MLGAGFLSSLGRVPLGAVGPKAPSRGISLKNEPEEVEGPPPKKTVFTKVKKKFPFHEDQGEIKVQKSK